MTEYQPIIRTAQDYRNLIADLILYITDNLVDGADPELLLWRIRRDLTALDHREPWFVTATAHYGHTRDPGDGRTRQNGETK